MAKVKTAYFCQNCGAQSAQWKGQCSACKEWNTLVEETISPASEAPVIGTTTLQTKKKAQKLDEINFETETRIDTRDQEFNRVLVYRNR